MLLRPGRNYEAAVKEFSPYREIKDVYPEGRDSIEEMLKQICVKTKKSYVYVNNRFEGHAPSMILDALDRNGSVAAGGGGRQDGCVMVFCKTEGGGFVDESSHSRYLAFR